MEIECTGCLGGKIMQNNINKSVQQAKLQNFKIQSYIMFKLKEKNLPHLMSNKMNGCYKLIHIRLTLMQSDIEYYLRQSPPLWKVNILNIGITNFLISFN